MLRAQIAALEQRIDALEEVLWVQAIILGQYIGRPPGKATPLTMDREAWLLELERAERHDRVPEVHNGIIEMLQMSLLVDYPPTAETLRARP